MDSKHNAARLFASLLILIAIISWISCSKKMDYQIPSSSPDTGLKKPIISSFYPDYAAYGDTFRISGKYLSGTTQVLIGAYEVLAFKVESDSSIRVVAGMGSKDELTGLTVRTPRWVVKKTGFHYIYSLKKMYGYDSSLQVAADKEIAYWSGEAEDQVLMPGIDYGSCDCPLMVREAHSRMKPLISVGVYGGNNGEGIKGNAIYLRDGYMVFPPLPQLNKAGALSSYTISLWIKGVASMGSILQLTGAGSSDIFGQIQISDTISNWADGPGWDLHLRQANYSSIQTSADYWGFGGLYDPQSILLSNWNHLALSFDGPSREMKLYWDGSLLVSRTSSSVVESANFTLELPMMVLFGTYAFKDDGFTNSFLANERPNYKHGITTALDEIRIFNAALSDKDILALTFLGRAGR
jgi:hypothetical protein